MKIAVKTLGTHLWVGRGEFILGNFQKWFKMFNLCAKMHNSRNSEWWIQKSKWKKSFCFFQSWLKKQFFQSKSWFCCTKYQQNHDFLEQSNQNHECLQPWNLAAVHDVCPFSEVEFAAWRISDGGEPGHIAT